MLNVTVPSIVLLPAGQPRCAGIGPTPPHIDRVQVAITTYYTEPGL